MWAWYLPIYYYVCVKINMIVKHQRRPIYYKYEILALKTHHNVQETLNNFRQVLKSHIF